MAREPITKHGRDHRLPLTDGPDDPGGHDPITWLEPKLAQLEGAGWLSWFDIPLRKPPAGTGFTVTIDATLAFNFKLVHTGSFATDFNHSIYGVFPLGPRGWYPLMSLSYGAGWGTIDGYIAGAYDLSGSNTIIPAFASGAWVQFSHLDLGHNAGGVPLVGNTPLDRPFWPPNSIAESMGGSFSFDEATAAYTTATTHNSLTGETDGGRGYYFVRFDFDGAVEIGDLGLAAQNWK